MGLYLSTPLAQCKVTNAGTASPPVDANPSPDRQKPSSGVTVPTPSPSPVAQGSGQTQTVVLSPEQAAEKAVSTFIDEQYKPDGGKADPDLVKILQNSAICAAEDFLTKQQRQSPQDPVKLGYSERLYRKAQQTIQGRAETWTDIIAKKLSDLLAKEQDLKQRCEARPRQSLSDKEVKQITHMIREALGDLKATQKAWNQAVNTNTDKHTEPYGDAKLCKAGLESANNTMRIAFPILFNLYLHIKELNPEIKMDPPKWVTP
jgi:hypothetical protein